MTGKPFSRMKDAKGRYLRDALGRYRYEIYLRLGGRNSKKVHRRLWLKNDDEAHLWIAKIRHDPAATRRITWMEAYEAFCADNPALSPVYLKDMKRAVGWIAKHCGEQVTGTTKAAYSAALRQKAAEASGRTANLYRAMTLSVARWLQEEGIIETIPFEHVAKRPEAASPRTPFRPDEIPAYATALPVPARLLFLGLAACGERVSALANARYSDIDTARGVLWVTKKGGTRRAIPINEALRLVIEQASLAAPNAKTEDGRDFIFFNARGRKWTVKQFDKTVKEAFVRAGLKPKIPHELRHMVGSELADANTSRDVISATLGHERTITADHYVRGRQMDRSALLGLRTWDGALVGHIAAIFGLEAPPPDEIE